MYLVDTNVWLEVLLRQERLDEARRFLTTVETRFLAITDFPDFDRTERGRKTLGQIVAERPAENED